MTYFIGSFPCALCQAKGKRTLVKVYDRMPSTVMCMKCRRITERVDDSTQEPEPEES